MVTVFFLFWKEKTNTPHKSEGRKLYTALLASGSSGILIIDKIIKPVTAALFLKSLLLASDQSDLPLTERADFRIFSFLSLSNKSKFILISLLGLEMLLEYQKIFLDQDALFPMKYAV